MIKSWIVICKKNIHNICTPPLAYTLKESSRVCASRAPSSVHSRSWVQSWKPGGSQMPALPPSPASSPAVVWQPLCSPSAPTIYAVGASRDCHPPAWSEFPSTLPPPRASAMAPSSLLSTVAWQSTSSSGLPRPSGSALVWLRPSYTSELHSSVFALSLHPSGSVRLLHPLGSSSLFCHSGSTMPSRINASATVAGVCSA